MNDKTPGRMSIALNLSAFVFTWFQISAKLGTNVESVLQAVIERIPP